MHALGMEHTHDRFDRDNFILINTGAVNVGSVRDTDKRMFSYCTCCPS